MSGDNIIMVVSPFDPDVSVTFDGPPVPFGYAAFGAEIDGWSYSGGVTNVYLSEKSYSSLSGDNPESTIFLPRLAHAINYEVNLFQGPEPQGESKPGFGTIQIANPDGGIDSFLGYYWDGRALALYRQVATANGSQRFAFYDLAFQGTIAGIEYDPDIITMKLRDRQGIFDRDCHQSFYGGNGGTDGTSDLTGKGIPDLWGQAFNIPPVPFDPTNLVYQISNRAIASVDAVRDKGVALTLDTTVGTSGFVTSYAALVAASIASGKYAVCLDPGMVALGSSPAGLVTCDATGLQTTTGTIIRELVKTSLGGLSLTEQEIDQSAFSGLETSQPAVVGYWVGTEPVTARKVMDDLMRGIGGYWYMDLDGDLVVGLMAAPSGDATLTLTTATIGARRPPAREGLIPSWQRAVGWQPLWSVQTGDALASGVSQDDRGYYGEQTRYAASSSSAIRGQHLLARDVVVPGFFAVEADALAEAVRQQTLYGVLRDVYTLQVDLDIFTYTLGAIAAVTDFGRFGWGSTEKFRIIGAVANSKDRSMILRLWR
jgi:hypothetical protein